MTKRHEDISKFLSFILRHEPEAIGLTLDNEGWANINALIDGATTKEGKQLDLSLIKEVVAGSDKKRFAISGDGLSIRAVQGHSTKEVDINYVEKIPPEFLYHGTASRFLDSIKEKGLVPGSRHYVHLSVDEITASSVGQRHGKPVIIKINSQFMHEQGMKFYQAENGVWLTKNVKPQYFCD